MGLSAYGYSSSTASLISNLSGVLLEPKSVIQALLAPEPFSGCGHYAPKVEKTTAHYVRYCEECAKHGYHCPLHEAPWLALCPFHEIALTQQMLPTGAGAISHQRVATLRDIMKPRCASWPGCRKAAQSSFSVESMASLQAWLANVQVAASGLANHEIWRSRYIHDSASESAPHAIDKLRALSPMQNTITHLVETHGDTWRFAKRRLPHEFTVALDRLAAKGLTFASVFEYFKDMATKSARPPSFVTRRVQAQRKLALRHGECRCEWAYISGGWTSFWRRVHPDDWPRMGSHCPYAVAINTLAQGWGNPSEALSLRAQSNEHERLLQWSRIMLDAGIARLVRHPTPTHDLYEPMSPDPAYFEWNSELPMTAVLNELAEEELDITYESFCRWIDAIERGAHPGSTDASQSALCLVKTADGTDLSRWHLVGDSSTGHSRSHI
ncbi:hypothetical protein PCO31010_00203 [Pandoraea commovens]|uniref:Uncharacterized protein n=1 Tax=Pandoraea commovens TaxID=2508289 RepID=A0A5E4RI32_9BURK|nr:hypothetical protein PCO31010_00203 [Pandoraea commovens]